MSIFKTKPKVKWFEKTFWWKGVKNWWEKKTGTLVNKDDPEFDAQKIYQHWLNSFK